MTKTLAPLPRMLARFFAPALLGLVAIYCAWTGFFGAWWWFIFSAVCNVVALGLLAWKDWARYAWYAMVGLMIAGWLGAIAYLLWLWSPGVWTGNQAVSWLVPLIPGCVFLVVCGFGAAATRSSYAARVRPDAS